MTITITKKHVFIGVCSIAALFIIFLLAKFFFGSRINYEETAKDMKINAMAVSYLSSEILSDYQQNWQKAINDHYVINADGNRVYCSDFNEAVNMRYNYYINNGMIYYLDSLCNIVKDDMRKMNDATSSKYEKTQDAFMEIYNNMNSLVSLVKQPKGSLMTFGRTVDEIVIIIEKKNKETDLIVPVSENEIINKTTEILSMVAEKKDARKRKLEEKKREESKKNGQRMKEDGYTLLPNGEGVMYKIIRQGDGPKPEINSLVRVNYEGRLLDGTVFDSSYERGEPAEMYVDRIVKGWTYILPNMPSGSKWEVYIPYHLAYGEKEAGQIKPYSDLLFTIELIKIVK